MLAYVVLPGQSVPVFFTYVQKGRFSYDKEGGRTGLVVRALDSGSGDPGSILSRVGVLFPWTRDIYSPKYW